MVRNPLNRLILNGINQGADYYAPGDSP